MVGAHHRDHRGHRVSDQDLCRLCSLCLVHCRTRTVADNLHAVLPA
jgi:hypothetical protein